MAEQTTTDQRDRKQTDHQDMPPLIESDLAASQVTSTEPAAAPDISDYPTVPLVPLRREFHVNYWLIVTALLLLVLIAEHISPVIAYMQTTYFHHQAHVTLFTTTKRMSTTYAFLAVTGTADPQQKQVPSRLLTFTTTAQTLKITTTGIGYTLPVQATGEIIFYNEAPYAQTIDAGTVIEGNDGIQIVTDETVTIAAGAGATNGSGKASAHTIQAGSTANIASYDVNRLCCLSGIRAINTSSFTGGKDPQAYPKVSKEDADTAVKKLTTDLDPQAKHALVGQVQSTEQQLTPLHCSVSRTVLPKVGEKATSATVTVFESCSVQVYDYAALERQTTQHFTQDITATFGRGFIPKHDVTLAIEKISLLDSRHTIYQLAVMAQGSVIFHPSVNQLQKLTQMIAGKSITQARSLLLAHTGIAGAYIQPLDNSQTLPTDPNQIQMSVS